MKTYNVPRIVLGMMRDISRLSIERDLCEDVFGAGITYHSNG